MRNLEAVQQGLKVVRDALTPLIERVLTDEYGEAWWQKGVLDALVRDQKPITDRPEKGDAGDIDLQLALKLVQVYHWELFSDDLDWGGKERSLIAAVTAVRNQYEGHVTPNREAELTDEKTRALLEGMELFLNRFDRRAGEKIGNLAEILKMQQPEPEAEPEWQTTILRRPVPKIVNRPARGEPERITRAPITPRPEPTLRNGAGDRSMPEQAKPAWKRKPVMRWGAAVRSDGPYVRTEEPARTPDTPANAAKPDHTGEHSRMRDIPANAAQTSHTGESPRMRDIPANAARSTPTGEIPRVRDIPANAAHPDPEEEAPARQPDLAAEPPAQAQEAAGLPPESRPDPELFEVEDYSRRKRGEDAPPSDPELYIPASVPAKTPRRLQQDPYEVDILPDTNRKGQRVLRVDRPSRASTAAKAEPEEKKPRRALPTGLILRIVGLLLLGVALGVGLIYLDSWLPGILGR